MREFRDSEGKTPRGRFRLIQIFFIAVFSPDWQACSIQASDIHNLYRFGVSLHLRPWVLLTPENKAVNLLLRNLKTERRNLH